MCGLVPHQGALGLGGWGAAWLVGHKSPKEEGARECPLVRKVGVVVAGRRSLLHSRRKLGQGPECLGFYPSQSLNLLCALEQCPASHSPCLSVPIGTMRGWSQTISKDTPIPWISAVQRLKRPAKGSWPHAKLAERRVHISENQDTPSPNPILI